MCRPKIVRCFKCYKWFDKITEKVKHCNKCGDFKCPNCNVCMCNLTKSEQKIVMAMIHTYEKFIKDELKITISLNIKK